MSTAKRCPTCQHENEAEAAYCSRCGTLLEGKSTSLTTIPVSEAEQQEDLTPHRPPPKMPPLRGNTLALFVMGGEQPILASGGEPLILGRDAPHEDDEGALIDLGQYGAHQAGISRRHALIAPSRDGYTIKDLGSTNGTLLNGTPLLAEIPYWLQSGDQIRLGALTLYVYFKL